MLIVECNQSSRKGTGWHADLAARGYAEPLPAPIPAVQATLAAMSPNEIHQFIQANDRDALDKNELTDSGETPLLLNSLDLGQWIRVFEFANTDLPKALQRLRDMQLSLLDIANRDMLEYEEAKGNTVVVEVYLKQINPQDTVHATSTDSGISLPTTSLADIDEDIGVGLCHPFLKNLALEEAHKAAIEDVHEGFLLSQAEKEQDSFSSSTESLSIPFMPPRAVEDLVATRNHRVWTIGNINLLAPIPPHVWRVWAGLKSDELKACIDAALHNRSVIRGMHDLAQPYSLSMFDHGKCGTHAVKIQVKQDLSTGRDRKENYITELWNSLRPYMRCHCNPRAVHGCQGAIMWWDHAIWFMANNLERFFSDDLHPTLVSKFAAFCVWMAGTGRLATKSHLAFLQSRTWMTEAAILFAASPNATLVTRYPDLPGLRKVERLLKPISFSLANPLVPSPAPPSKRSKMNCNARPNDCVPQAAQSPRQYSNWRGRGGGYHSRGRRGNTSTPRGGRTGNHYAVVESTFTPPSSSSTFSNASTASVDPAHRRPHCPPIKGRILSFDNDP